MANLGLDKVTPLSIRNIMIYFYNYRYFFFRLNSRTNNDPYHMEILIVLSHYVFSPVLLIHMLQLSMR